MQDDAIDRAQMAAEVNTEDAIAAHFIARRVVDRRARAAVAHLPTDERHCEGCGNPIPTARLHLVPEARFCTPCADVLESQFRSGAFT